MFMFSMVIDKHILALNGLLLTYVIDKTLYSEYCGLWPGTEKPQEVASSTCGNCTGGSTNCRPTHSKSSS